MLVYIGIHFVVIDLAIAYCIVKSCIKKYKIKKAFSSFGKDE